MYWNNSAIGSNSYDPIIKNSDNTAYSISHDGTAGNSSKASYNLLEMVPQWKPVSWMKDIDDNKPVTNLTLPGTHNSGAIFSPGLSAQICYRAEKESDWTLTLTLDSNVNVDQTLVGYLRYYSADNNGTGSPSLRAVYVRLLQPASQEDNTGS